MKIIELWKEGKDPTLSFELFPARTEKGTRTLDRVIDKLLLLNPDFVSVTFGAGGSSRSGSFELVRKLQTLKVERILPYVASFGLSSVELEAVIDDYLSLGIDSFLCIRGDEPEETDLGPHPDGFGYASEFINHVAGKYPDSVAFGAAGYPEGHIDADSRESDWDFLKRKVDNGARFLIANYFFDNAFFYQFRDGCAKRGIEVPLIAGIMPIFNVKLLKSLSAKCGASIPESLQAGLAAIDVEDKAAVQQFGMTFARVQCEDLLKNKVDGLHFYTMDKSKSVVAIVEGLREQGYLKKSSH